MDEFPPTVDLTNAFPGREYMSREWWPGMTIREVFAAAVVAGIYANPASTDLTYERIKHTAYTQADWMMAERNKTL